jgi:hypothetical protein
MESDQDPLRWARKRDIEQSFCLSEDSEQMGNYYTIIMYLREILALHILV